MENEHTTKADVNSRDIAQNQADSGPLSKTDGGVSRPNKRKVDDVFRGLDRALGPLLDDVENTRHTKRAHSTRSLYSTLAKYGIKGRETKPESGLPIDSSHSNTPHLSAIISRTAALSRRATPSFRPTGIAPSTTSAPSKEYSTTSVTLFLNRLATFKLATYANQPSQLDAAAAARCGWINNGKNRLLCEICGASWVVASREGMSWEAASALVEKQKGQLVSQHKNLCPWKDRQCDPSIYRIPLKAPSLMAKELKLKSLSLEKQIEGVAIKHPLTPTQAQTLVSTLASIHLNDSSFNMELPPADAVSQTQLASPLSNNELSETAAIVSLFGWTLAPSLGPADRSNRVTASSISRTTFFTSRKLPSASNFTQHSRISTATPSASGPPASTQMELDSISTRTSVSSARHPPTAASSITQGAASKPEATTMLQCILCQRRIGVWAFNSPKRNSNNSYSGVVSTAETSDNNVEPLADSTNDAEIPDISSSLLTTTASGQRSVRPLPYRSFDVLKEHRAHCPYVVRSTTVPSFSTSTPLISTNIQIRSRSTSRTATELEDKIEGWRAVLLVVSRYGLEHRQRLRKLGVPPRISAPPKNSFSPTTSQEPLSTTEEETDVDRVGAMLDVVKARGGSSVLKYVKSILG